MFVVSPCFFWFKGSNFSGEPAVSFPHFGGIKLDTANVWDNVEGFSLNNT